MGKKKKNKDNNKEKKLLKAEKAGKSAKKDKAGRAEKDSKQKKQKKSEAEFKSNQIKGSTAGLTEKKAAQRRPIQLSLPDEVISSGTEISGEASNKLQESAEIFRALGDENRMQILSLLKEGEMCVVEILQSVSIVQSTLSHHLKILTNAGVICCRKQGKWSYYSINNDTLKKAARYVGEMEQESWEKE